MSPSPGGAGQGPAYVLGHADHELDRLKRQAEIIGPVTERIFRAAGIGPGMRVLDVGSGAGDVAFLAADIVGPSGEVVGADLAARGIELARARAAARGGRNVTFHVGDPGEMTFDRPFDAALGRHVLQFQDAPSSMLRIALLRTPLPEAERQGVTTAAEVDLDTLSRRMIDEVIASSGVLIGPFQVGAWTRV